MKDEITVSVYSLAYNHEKYLRSAPEDFVTQTTDFRYEVFVHEDASTDGTAETCCKRALGRSRITEQSLGQRSDPILRKECLLNDGRKYYIRHCSRV